MSFNEAKQLWEDLLLVKVNCEEIELSKYLILIEKVLETFNNIKEEERMKIKLKIDVDNSLIPTKLENDEELNVKIKTKMKSFNKKIKSSRIDLKNENLENLDTKIEENSFDFKKKIKKEKVKDKSKNKDKVNANSNENVNVVDKEKNTKI